VRIVVNADDLGKSETLNEQIFDGLRRGVITSATILTNGPATEHAASKLSRYTHCSFGVHLNLTEFAPLCDDSHRALSPIVDDAGRFREGAIHSVRLTPQMLRGIYREWCGQIEKAMTLGVAVTHLDSHHHVHTIPAIYPVLLAVRNRYKIRRIRLSMNVYPAASARRSGFVRVQKAVFNFALRRAGFMTARLFTDLGTFIDNFAACCPEKNVIELMVHPGSGAMNPAAQREAALLRGYWPDALSYPVRLITYRQV